MTGKCPKCGNEMVVTPEFIGCDKCNKVFYNSAGYSSPKIKLTKQRIKELRQQEKDAQMEFDFMKQES